MIPRHLEASFCGAERIAKAASSPNMFCESLKYFSLMNRNRPSRTNAVLIFSEGGRRAFPPLLGGSEDARFEKLTTVLSRIRKTFYRFELLWELLRQASLHNEAVQDSWTALFSRVDRPHSRLGHGWKRNVFRIDFHPAPLHFESSFREQADREGKEDVLLLQDSRCERLLRIVLMDRDRFLKDNRSPVDGRIGEMDCASGDLDTGREGIPLGVGPGEGRQQRGVDVHDAHRELPNEVGGHEAHEPREDDEVRPLLPQDLHDLPFECGPVFPERPMVHDNGGGNPPPRPAPHPRPRGPAADDDGVC